MPFLRQLSSSRATEHDSESEPHSQRPSLLRRLSRRSSSHERIGQEQKSTNSHGRDGGYATAPAEERKVTPEHYGDKQHYANPADSEANNSALANGLTKEDVRALFFGAPHFVLEKGRHGKAFPQAFFPWNSDLEVSDLSDRQYLSHESFSLATLHAHLPIPDERTFRPSEMPQKREEAWKRPMMDLGIFETPNMLHAGGREPGTVGLRFFLELPMSEKLRTSEKAKQEQKGGFASSSISRHSTTDYSKGKKHEAEVPQIGKHASRQDRMQLIREGPPSWEHLGIRDIQSSTIIERLAIISALHDKVLKEGLPMIILHHQNCSILHQQLFSQLLYPPENKKALGADPEIGLKIQIESLVKILTTPGAWVDFSLVEPRIRLGQGLWQLPPYDSGADLGLPADAERKWLLIQILLSIELMIRLDAALKLGSSDKFRDFHLSGDEIHHFNKMRSSKVDWDLVIARRFLDLLEVKNRGEATFPKSPDGDQCASSTLLSFDEKHKLHEKEPSIWDCVLLPRRASFALEGLFRFVRIMDWPRADNIEKDLTSRWQSSPGTADKAFAEPIPATCCETRSTETSNNMTSFFSRDDWVERAYLTLQPATKVLPGGWTSRSWLTAIASPGEAGSICIMSCLLENDRKALSKLGCRASLHGGFVLDGRSWWHKRCIVSRVLAPSKGATECMEWVNTPSVLPLDAYNEAYCDVWLDVCAEKAPVLRDSLRINDGQKLAEESSVLGSGQGKLLSSEFSMVTDNILNDLQPPAAINLADLVLRRKNTSDSRDHTLSASLSFDVYAGGGSESVRQHVNLAYNVVFVSSHPCRLPHGHAVFPTQAEHQQPHHRAHEHLPSHPLHKSYKYAVKSVFDLTSSSPPDPTKRENATWIVDARGRSEADMFVRAWCSKIGRSALIARSGDTCLSCAIREAKALEVGIIVRVGFRQNTQHKVR